MVTKAILLAMTEVSPNSNIAINSHTLRQSFIENEIYPQWQDIERGEVINRCTKQCLLYSRFWQDAGIDHAMLCTTWHSYMIVETADKGFLVFDPTIKQIYPDYKDRYFLGTPEELNKIIEEHGGWETDLEDGNTATVAYMNPRLRLPMIDILHQSTHVPYSQKWLEASKEFSPQKGWIATVESPIKTGLSLEQARIPVGVESVIIRNSVSIGRLHALEARKSAHQHE